MANPRLSIAQFEDAVRPLLGIEVSLAWKGYGSAIFLELGRLAPLTGRQRHNQGEACLSLVWDWRVESGSRVLFGSSNSGPKIQDGLNCLQGVKIEALAVAGPVCELSVLFSSGQYLRSMVMLAGDPQWSIRLLDSRWLSSKDGLLLMDGGEPRALSEDEAAEFTLAEKAARRWGTPMAEPKLGSCRDCRSYVRLDGPGHLLDFGACAESASPFDGRTVRCTSGCPAFSQA